MAKEKSFNCEYCDNVLSIEEKFCSGCGKANPNYKPAKNTDLNENVAKKFVQENEKVRYAEHKVRELFVKLAQECESLETVWDKLIEDINLLGINNLTFKPFPSFSLKIIKDTLAVFQKRAFGAANDKDEIETLRRRTSCSTTCLPICLCCCFVLGILVITDKNVMPLFVMMCIPVALLFAYTYDAVIRKQKVNRLQEYIPELDKLVPKSVSIIKFSDDTVAFKKGINDFKDEFSKELDDVEKIVRESESLIAKDELQKLRTTFEERLEILHEYLDKLSQLIGDPKKFDNIVNSAIDCKETNDKVKEILARYGFLVDRKSH